MGAENHSEVKVTFHKGNLTISSINEEKRHLAVCYLFNDFGGESITDRISKVLEPRGINKSLRMTTLDTAALEDCLFASNPCILSAVIAIAVRRLADQLEGIEGSSIAPAIESLALEMFTSCAKNRPDEAIKLVNDNMHALADREAACLISTIMPHPESNGPQKGIAGGTQQ